MAGRARKIPAYRLHKPSGQAVVRIDGRDHYLGRHDTDRSREAYDRRIAEWLANGRATFPDRSDAGEAGPGLSVNELALAFREEARRRYRRPDGTLGPEFEKISLAIRPLRTLYGLTPARDFGPRALKVVRQAMVDAGLCRRTINQRVGRIVRLFRFGVENEWVPPGVHQALKAVEGLRAGAARESKAVRPVADGLVDATLPFLSRQLRAVVELQRLTGMRSGEVLSMRGCDLDETGGSWVYTPQEHKTAHKGKDRQVYLGPRAREVLRPWLRGDPLAYLFQPREAAEERLATRRRARKSPLTPSQRARTRKVRPARAPGERYDARAYAHAVGRACDRAFPHPTLSGVREEELTPLQRAELKAWRGEHRWHPHQLRHSAATRLRQEFGLDAARAVLGHSSTSVTEVYAELDKQKAASAMERLG